MRRPRRNHTAVFKAKVAVVALILLFLLTLATLVNLVTTSVEKARSIRQERFDRDLRELAGRFDADERYVLEKNLTEVAPEFRTSS